jgi:hypothetical protein
VFRLVRSPLSAAVGSTALHGTSVFRMLKELNSHSALVSTGRWRVWLVGYRVDFCFRPLVGAISQCVGGADLGVVAFGVEEEAGEEGFDADVCAGCQHDAGASEFVLDDLETRCWRLELGCRRHGADRAIGREVTPAVAEV